MLNWQIVRCILTCILSFSFVHAPVCANCKSDSCNIIQKKKKKMTHTSVWVKNTKVMPQKPCYLSFPWEREGILRLRLYKNPKLSALSALPSSTQNIFQVQALCGRCMPKNSHKIDQKIFFLQISHLSSNRRVRNLTLYFQFTTPARKLTHRTKFEYPGRHEFRTRHVSSLP